jgi:hypothetical protein
MEAKWFGLYIADIVVFGTVAMAGAASLYVALGRRAWEYIGANAQHPSTTTHTVRLAGGVVRVDAGRAELIGTRTAFSDGVFVTVNGVRIAAERAAIERSDAARPEPEEITLEGSVTLRLSKQP